MNKGEADPWMAEEVAAAIARLREEKALEALTDESALELALRLVRELERRHPGREGYSIVYNVLESLDP